LQNASSLLTFMVWNVIIIIIFVTSRILQTLMYFVNDDVWTCSLDKCVTEVFRSVLKLPVVIAKSLRVGGICRVMSPENLWKFPWTTFEVHHELPWWECQLTHMQINSDHSFNCFRTVESGFIFVIIDLVNKISNVHSRCGLGNTHFISVHQVSLPVDFWYFATYSLIWT